VSVAQVARRYALNADMIFKWLRDARCAPGSVHAAVDLPIFLPVEAVSPTRSDVARAMMPDTTLSDCLLEMRLPVGIGFASAGSMTPRRWPD